MPELSPDQKRRITRWRRAIINSWQKQVHAVVATGRLLIRAHDDLIAIHGAWISMVRNDLPFSYATAKRLMAIALHPVLSHGSHVNHLPAAWSTLYQLSLIDQATLVRLIKAGDVHPAIEREDVERLRQRLDLGSEMAVIPPPKRKIENALRAMQASIDRTMNAIYDQISAGELTNRELELMFTTFNDVHQIITEFIATIQRMEVRPMRTIEPETTE
jgi:hypothetical protein